MNEALDKIQSHVAVMLKGKRLTKEEGEHLVRHFKGILAGVGDLFEANVKHLTQ